MTDLTLNINAKNNTATAVNAALRSLGELGNAAERVANLTLSITVPPIMGAAAAYRSFLQLDEARTKAMIAGDYNDDDMKALEKQADLLSEKFGMLRSEIYEMFTQFGKSGIAVGNMQSLAESVTKLSVLTDGLSGAGAFDAINVSAKAFGLSLEKDGDQVAALLNSLDDVGTGALTTVPNIAHAFSQVGLIANKLGLTMRETGAMITELMDAGDTEAGIHIRTALMALTNISKEGEKSLESLGLTINDLFSGGKLRLDAFGLIRHRFEEMNLDAQQRLAVLGDIFGRTGAAAASTFTESLDKIGERFMQLDETGSTMARQIGQYQESAAFQAQQAWVLLHNAMEEVGAAMLPLVQEYLPVLVAHIKEWTEWLKDPANAKFVADLTVMAVKLAAIALAVKTVIAVCGTLKGIITSLSAAYGLMGTAASAAGVKSITAAAASSSAWIKSNVLMSGKDALALGKLGGAGAAAVYGVGAAWNSATSEIGGRAWWNLPGRAGDWIGTLAGGGSLSDANQLFTRGWGEEDAAESLIDSSYEMNDNLNTYVDEAIPLLNQQTEALQHLDNSMGDHLQNLNTLPIMQQTLEKMLNKQTGAYAM
jgi:TP901 family phage tail tape measure protein